MSMHALAMALPALLSTAAPTTPVTMAAFECPGLAVAEVRALLQVELGRRFGGSVAAGDDFVLVSVACDRDTANLLAVRQGVGPPLRRQLALSDVVADARPRHIAVAIAELLRAEGAAPPAANTAAAPVAAKAPPSGAASFGDAATGVPVASRAGEMTGAALEVVEPVVMSALTKGNRAGVRTRVGHTEIGTGSEKHNFYVLSIEPFVDFAVTDNVVATLVQPVTWTNGPDQSRGGELANLTGGIRYTAGDRLRVGAGAAVSLNLGHPPPAHAEANLFELDRFRDDTASLRLAANVLWRPDRLYVQGELAVVFLGYDPQLKTLIRAGAAAGLAFERWAFGVEYLVLTDVVETYFTSGDRLVQSLITGARWSPGRANTVGLHLQLGLDQSPNLQPGLLLSFAHAF